MLHLYDLLNIFNEENQNRKRNAQYCQYLELGNPCCYSVPSPLHRSDGGGDGSWGGSCGGDGGDGSGDGGDGGSWVVMMCVRVSYFVYRSPILKEKSPPLFYCQLLSTVGLFTTGFPFPDSVLLPLDH